MRFSFEEFHIWHQFANSLICARKVSTLLIVRECDVCTIYTYYVDTAVRECEVYTIYTYYVGTAVRECDVYTIYTYYIGTAVCIMLSHRDFPTAFSGLNIGPSPNVKKAFFFQFHRAKFPIAW